MAAAAVVGALAVPAQAASSSSSLNNVGGDFQSRRWTDDGGSTTIKFTSCPSAGTQAITVTLRKDVFGPDPTYSTATFTNCFNSGATSSGSWDDRGSGDYCFVVNYASNTYVTVSVKSLSVYY